MRRLLLVLVVALVAVSSGTPMEPAPFQGKGRSSSRVAAVRSSERPEPLCRQRRRNGIPPDPDAAPRSVRAALVAQWKADLAQLATERHLDDRSGRPFRSSAHPRLRVRLPAGGVVAGWTPPRLRAQRRCSRCGRTARGSGGCSAGGAARSARPTGRRTARRSCSTRAAPAPPDSRRRKGASRAAQGSRPLPAVVAEREMDCVHPDDGVARCGADGRPFGRNASTRRGERARMDINCSPSWSPDGRHIVFRGPARVRGLRGSSADGRGARRKRTEADRHPGAAGVGLLGALRAGLGMTLRRQHWRRGLNR